MIVFDADQEYYAKEYQQIVEKRHFTLIGIPTSTGGMYVGPLLTYVYVLVYWISSGNPVGVHLVTVLLISLQPGVIFWLLLHLKNYFVGLLAAIITLCSSLLWFTAYFASPISLLFPLGLLFFYGLIICKPTKQWCFGMALLLGLSIQIHFSLLIFFPIFILYLLVSDNFQKIPAKFYALMLIVILLSLFPLILFDLRHNALISHNLLKFIFTGSPQLSYVGNISRVLQSTTAVFSSLLIPNLSFGMRSLLMISVIVFLIKYRKTIVNKAAITSLGVFLLLLLLYRGPLPDYYFFAQLPVFIFVLAQIVERISQFRFGSIIVFSFLAVIMLTNVGVTIKSINPYNLFVKQKAVAYIKNQVGDKPVAVSIDTDLGLQYGFDYLLDYYRITRLATAPTAYEIRLRQHDNKTGIDFRQDNSPNAVKVVKVN